MPDYKELYLRLFNRVTDVIEQLQKAQQEAEEAFLDHTDAPITPIRKKTGQKDKTGDRRAQ